MLRSFHCLATWLAGRFGYFRFRIQGRGRSPRHERMTRISTPCGISTPRGNRCATVSRDPDLTAQRREYVTVQNRYMNFVPAWRPNEEEP